MLVILVLERSVARPCLVSVMALLLFGCAPMPAPVPHDAEVVDPYPDVRPVMAAFSGRWQGIWEPGHVQGVIVVEQILPSQARIVLATGGPGGGSWGRYILTTPRDQDPVEFRASFTDPDGLQVALKLWMPSPEFLMAEMEVRRSADTGTVISRARLQRATTPPVAPRAATAVEGSEIRCPVPVHHSLPHPAPGPYMEAGSDTPANRAFAARMYERAKADVLDPRFPDDPGFKRAYLLMWQDWAARRAGAPAVSPRDREWFWRFRCEPGTVERLRTKYPALFEGASP